MRSLKEILFFKTEKGYEVTGYADFLDLANYFVAQVDLLGVLSTQILEIQNLELYINGQMITMQTPAIHIG